MEDIKESKKVLTDYMLELNADIQRAEDWVNTGADEEIYFALKTVLDRLEQLEKENKELKVYDNIEYQKYLYGNIEENYIPKSVIRKKIEEYREKRNKLADGYFWDKASNINEDTSLFIAGEVLKELLGEEK